MLEAIHILSTMTAPMTAMITVGAALTDGGFPWLSVVTFAPLLGVLALMLIPREQVGALRNTALIFSLLVFVISLGILLNFDPNPTETAGAFTFQLMEGPYDWIPSLGISYAMGIDGISLWLVLMTTFLMPITIFSTYAAVQEHVKEYMIALLFIETAMLGTFMAVDVFLFYIFWEMVLIPMYLIIGIWGGEKRILAAVKFFIFTMVGSLLMLIAILYVYFHTNVDGQHSFMLADFMAVDLSFKEQFFLFAAFALAFAIKVPLFPVHTWLPLAHVQAPTAGSVVLAAVLLKMGTYGLLRFAIPLFPDAAKTFAPYIAVLSVIGIIYAALVAMVQDDMKKVIAYSSVAHLGFCVLGLVAMNPIGVAGSIYVMIAHGVATGGLFLCVGILKERRHTMEIKEFGGISKQMPVFSGFFGLIMLASVGLPGLNGFIGEFMAMLGASNSNFLWFKDPLVFVRSGAAEGARQGFELVASPVFPLAAGEQAGPEITALIFAILAASGVIFAAGYLLWMFRRVMFGPLENAKNKVLHDLNAREVVYLVPIALMVIFMGVYPKFFLSRMDNSIDQFLRYMDSNVSAKGSVRTEKTDQSKWVPEGTILDGTADED